MGGFRRMALVLALVVVSSLVSAPPAAAAQVSGPKPTIAGRAVVDQTLTAQPGVWRPSGTSLAYQWFRVSGRTRAAIPGAVKVSYRVQPADVGHPLIVRVTGSKRLYTSLTLWSNPTAPVVKATLTRTSTPTIAGTARVGRTLTARAGTWAPAPVTLAYQWYRDGVAISGADGSTYRLRDADWGHRLKVRVAGSRAGYVSVPRWSAATAVVTRPLIRTPTPRIVGTVRAGRTLTARAGSWGPAPVGLAYQWYRGFTPIRGAHRSTYGLRIRDVGHRIRVLVTGFKTGYSPSGRWSAATARVGKAWFRKAPAPRFSGTVEVGQLLTADPGRWDPRPVKLKYRWYCNRVAIRGATRSTYLVRPGDLGCELQVKVTASRPGYKTLGKESPPSTPVQVARVQVSAGGQHTCLVNAQGGVLCWGSNALGALGDGTTTDRHTPVPVVGLSSGVRSVAAGSRHTCALTLAGGVTCWGGNSHGQLGDGSTVDRTTPVDVVGLASGVKAISSGYDYSCAVLDDGAVRCWGMNNLAQLGDANDPWDSPTPVDVIGVGGQSLLSDIEQIAPGGYAHTCAITAEAGVDCWGMNFYGQLGDGTDRHSAIAVAVAGLSRVPIVAIGVGTFHSCGVTSWGAVKCWGRGEDGQLGNGDVIEQHAPRTMPGLIKGVASIAVGGSHNCALKATGEVVCWGSGEWGALGNGDPSNSSSPVQVDGLDGMVVSLSSGGGHTCAAIAVPVGDPLKVRCWGQDWFGQLGDGTTGDAYHRRTTPVAVVGLP